MTNGITPALLKRLLPSPSVQLFMPRQSGVAFVEFPSVAACQEVFLSLDGVCVQTSVEELGLQHLVASSFLTGPPIHLYMFFLTAIPTEVFLLKTSISAAGTNGENYCMLPQGLTLLCDFITADEEVSLLDYFQPTNEFQWKQPAKLKGSSNAGMIGRSHTTKCQSAQGSSPGDDQADSLHSCNGPFLACVPLDINQTQSTTDLSLASGGHAVRSDDCSKTLKLRTVKHFGYEFLYGRNTVDISRPLPEGIPALCTPILKRITSSQLVDHTPDQLTVNVYKPGEGKCRIFVCC